MTDWTSAGRGRTSRSKSPSRSTAKFKSPADAARFAAVKPRVCSWCKNGKHSRCTSVRCKCDWCGFP